MVPGVRLLPPPLLSMAKTYYHQLASYQTSPTNTLPKVLPDCRRKTPLRNVEREGKESTYLDSILKYTLC